VLRGQMKIIDYADGIILNQTFEIEIPRSPMRRYQKGARLWFTETGYRSDNHRLIELSKECCVSYNIYFKNTKHELFFV